MPSFVQEPYIVVAGCCFIFLLCLFIIWFVVAYQRSTFKFLQEKQVMESAFKEQLLQSQIEVQEATFSAMGKELHDNIGQLLSTTKMLIGITERAIPNPPDTLNTANETLGTAINELRSLSKMMNKEWLEQFSLIDNLQTEVNRINSAKAIQLHLTHPGKISLKADEQIILFRIMQEAIQNAIKHAEANNVYINMLLVDERLAISIRDNGRGFNVNEPHDGIGMLHLRQRAEILGGSIRWESEAGGCTVNIEIPVKPDAL
jgi:signal transduction histidine kinase